MTRKFFTAALVFALFSSAFAATLTGWQLLSDEVIEEVFENLASKMRTSEEGGNDNTRKYWLENAPMNEFNCSIFLNSVDAKTDASGWYTVLANTVTSAIPTPTLMNMFWGAKRDKILAEIRKHSLGDEVVILIDRFMPFWDGSHPHLSFLREEVEFERKWYSVSGYWENEQYISGTDRINKKRERLGVQHNETNSYEFVERQRSRNTGFPGAVAKLLRKLRTELTTNTQ